MRAPVERTLFVGSAALSLLLAALATWGAVLSAGEYMEGSALMRTQAFNHVAFLACVITAAACLLTLTGALALRRAGNARMAVTMAAGMPLAFVATLMAALVLGMTVPAPDVIP